MLTDKLVLKSILLIFDVLILLAKEDGLFLLLAAVLTRGFVNTCSAESIVE